jgi:hypothetical protein
VSVPVGPRVLVQTGGVAVTLVDLAAFSTGITFRAAIRTRPLGGREAALRAVLDDDLGRHRGAVDGFRLGVQLADGRKATTEHRWLGYGRAPDVVLMNPEGSSSETSADLSYWLWPVPPAGRLALVCAWPRLKVGEVRCEIDATPIRRAAAISSPLRPA